MLDVNLKVKLSLYSWGYPSPAYRSWIWPQKSFAIFLTAWGTMYRCCKIKQIFVVAPLVITDKNEKITCTQVSASCWVNFGPTPVRMRNLFILDNLDNNPEKPVNAKLRPSFWILLVMDVDPDLLILLYTRTVEFFTSVPPYNRAIKNELMMISMC